MATKNRTNPEQVRRMAQLACAAVAELAETGFPVLSIDLKDARRPRISVEASGPCYGLDSGVRRYGVDAAGAYQVRAATFCGCQIEWTERV